MRLGSLFSGIGGLDLGLAACGMTTVWHCEIDVSAAAVLGAHWNVPNLGDITQIQWEDVEPVDVLCGGFPCQDLSYAGRGAGLAGARSGLWTEYARAIRSLRPRFVVVENVAALLGRGMGRVLGDLATLGYDTSWGCLRASDVGAPHRRDRVFIVATNTSNERRWTATSDAARLAQRESTDKTDALTTGGAAWQVSGSGDRNVAADAGCERREGGEPIDSRLSGSSGFDADGLGPWGQYEGAIRRWEQVVGPAPEPTDNRGRLAPEFVEWMVGLPIGWTNVGISRTARLKGLGNIVVPQQGALAWSLLAPMHQEGAA